MVSFSSVVDKVNAYLEIISCGCSGSCSWKDVNCDPLVCTLETWRRIAFVHFADKFIIALCLPLYLNVPTNTGS